MQEFRYTGFVIMAVIARSPLQIRDLLHVHGLTNETVERLISIHALAVSRIVNYGASCAIEISTIPKALRKHADPKC